MDAGRLQRFLHLFLQVVDLKYVDNPQKIHFGATLRSMHERQVLALVAKWDSEWEINCSVLSPLG